MTSHYLDLRLLPDPETAPAQLLGALYDRLHITLVAARRDDIGVSFPGYAVNPRTLGNIMRLHGSAAGLATFAKPEWLRAVRDHVRIGAIVPTPAGAPHRTVQRRQFKTSVERLRRRRMRRKGETAEQVALAIPRIVEREPTIPFARLRSHSTGQTYCLFIAMGRLQAEPRIGTFNAHGLSLTTTIPWF